MGKWASSPKNENPPGGWGSEAVTRQGECIQSDAWNCRPSPGAREAIKKRLMSTEKAKLSLLVVWAFTLGLRSASLPDSILVSSNQGSDPTRMNPRRTLDIYFRDSFFLSGRAFSWTPNNHAWEHKFNDRMHTASPAAHGHREKQLPPEDLGVRRSGRHVSACSSLFSAQDKKPEQNQS